MTYSLVSNMTMDDDFGTQVSILELYERALIVGHEPPTWRVEVGGYSKMKLITMTY